MEGRKIAVFSARTAEAKRGRDIIVYDLRGVTDIADYFVLVTADSKAQIKAILESIRKDLKAEGVNKIGQEGNSSGKWVLLDFGDVVIHVFSEELREYYSLESLWGDAPKVNYAKEPEVVLEHARARETA